MVVRARRVQTPERGDAGLASRGHVPEKFNDRRIGISITSSILGGFLRRSSSCRISPSALPRGFRRRISGRRSYRRLHNPQRTIWFGVDGETILLPQRERE